jgi:4-azaleucine resistance transporter AzlC
VRRLTSEDGFHVDHARSVASYREELLAGFAAAAPFIVAVAPFTFALAAAAQSAGFTALETIGMSVFVFAGAAQLAAISLYAGGAGLLAIGLTALLINLRHIIYGLSLDRILPAESNPPRSILAFLLTDEAYGLTAIARNDRVRPDAFYLGVALTIYLPFIAFTAAAALFVSLIPDIDRLGLEFIFPLAFISFITPLLIGARPVAIAVVSAIVMIVFSRIFEPGVAILLAIIAGSLVGAIWKERG